MNSPPHDPYRRRNRAHERLLDGDQSEAARRAYNEATEALDRYLANPPPEPTPKTQTPTGNRSLLAGMRDDRPADHPRTYAKPE